MVRPVARLEQLSYYPQLCARAQQLAADGLTMAAIAARLNAEGYRPPKRREQFGAQGIRALLQRLGVRTRHTQQRRRPAPGSQPDEWGLRELAHALAMPHVTLYAWLKRGWLTARREPRPPSRWIVWADAAEQGRLRRLHQRSLSQEAAQRWAARPLCDQPPPADDSET